MYGERKNAGDIVVSTGNSKLTSWKSKRIGANEVTIEHLDRDAMQSKYNYMFQKLSDKAMGT